MDYKNNNSINLKFYFRTTAHTGIARSRGMNARCTENVALAIGPPFLMNPKNPKSQTLLFNFEMVTEKIGHQLFAKKSQMAPLLSRFTRFELLFVG